jgi:hypothetical protein
MRRRRTLKAFFAAMLVVLGSGVIAHAQGVREVEIRADFHGILIEPVEVKDWVFRHKTLKVERKVPLTLKPGEYEIGCQYHPKHAPAKLIVKEKAS